MKKKILLLAAALMMFMGIVSASSINGDYKGNPIVKVMSNGKQLETDEVPAVILDGHTVVPISTLRQLGASVTWDAYGYSVDVKMPQKNEVIDSYLKLANDAEMLRYIYFINDQLALANIINSGILQNSTTSSDFKMVTDQANRIAVDINKNWVNDLSNIKYYSEDMYILNDTNKALSKLKMALLNYDSSSASRESTTIKSNINILYNKYDKNIQNDQSNAYSTVVDHYK